MIRNIYDWELNLCKKLTIKNLLFFFYFIIEVQLENKYKEINKEIKNVFLYVNFFSSFEIKLTFFLSS